MKKTILVAVIVLIAAVSFSQPQITFKQTTHDYGTIKKGSDGNCFFVFKNTGNEPLMFSNLFTSGGAIQVLSYPKYPIAPGVSDTIKVLYATSKLGVMNNYMKPELKGALVYGNTNASEEKFYLILQGTVIE